MNVVTPEFIERTISAGPLAEARARILNGSAQPHDKAQWDKFSSWALICEEILDTEHSIDWYDDIVAELARRGFSFDQVDQMRRFAWKTVGWLNYDKMLWEWVHLDEKDIKIALDWQLKDGVIDRAEYDEGLAFLEGPPHTSAAL